MATNAMKIWGTTVQFNGNLIGEIEDVGRSTQTRSLIKIFTCDSTDESAEYLSSGIERGQLALQFVFDGEASGTFAQQQSDLDDDTSGTLLITMKNGATISVTARIVSLDTPGGPADGGHAVATVTFQLSGAVTYTPVAA